MLRHYLLWTGRTLAADPWTTLLNLFALSLGLVSFALAGAAALFLRSNDATLPNAERIYAVSEQIFNADGTTVFGRLPMTSSPAAGYFQADYPEIEAVTLLVGGDFLQSVVNGKSHQLAPLFFDDSFSRLFKLPLRYGDPDHAFSQPRAVILTSDTAERLFGDTDPVGQSLRLGTVDVAITGVLAPLPPPSIFRSTPGSHIDLLAGREVRDQVAPLQAEPDAWDDYAGYTMIMLPPGQSPDGLRAKLGEFASRHLQRLKHSYKFDLVPLTDVRQVLLDGFLGTDKTGLCVPQLLLVLGGLILFVASLNYANLAAAKAIDRLPESGMKKVLGAGRGDLMAQYLTESLTLTIAALALVVLLLAAIVGPFRQFSGIDLSRLLFHRPLFWLELLAGVTTATLAGGLYPAWLLSGQRAMAAALGGKVRPVRSRFASALIGLQFFAASTLLIMIIVVARQNDAVDRMAKSLGGNELLAIDTILDGQAIGPKDVRNALRDIPGILAVGGSNALPWSVGPEARRYFRDAEVTGQAVQGTDFEVTEDYFTVLGSHLLAGREFSADRGGDLKPDDDASAAAFNVVVDRDFAQAFGWTAEQAIGQSIWHNSAKGGSAPVQIVGVIETQPQVILAHGSSGAVYTLAPKYAVLPLVRLAPGARAEALAAIDRALIRLAPHIDWQRHFGDELYRDTAATLTAIFAALSGLALFAVVIALLGLTGMAVHVTNSRTEEIGIRKILGADQVTLIRLLSWDLTKPVLIASLAAWPLGYIAGRIYLSLFIGHTSLGPWPFMLSLAATMAIACLAVGWRVAAASAKNPADILRYE